MIREKPSEITVIGAGIVGLATALALAETDYAPITVVDAAGGVATHQTGHNSGVIHSGLYYRPGSLKAENCTRGREQMYRFCRENNIPHRRCGKVVVATDEGEIPLLQDLRDRGEANGLKNLETLTPADLTAREGHVRGVAGLFVPQTGIVDFKRVAETMAHLFTLRGGRIRTGFPVQRILRKKGFIELSGRGGTIPCRYLINCAGLQADRIARMSGVNPGLHIIPFRGEYYMLKPDKRDLVNHLIYPVPDPRFPFLGVHFTRMITGEVEAGPNAVLAFKREGYSKFSFSLKDTVDFLLYPGFWKMVGRHWRMGLAEQVRSLSKTAFTRALRRLIPEIRTSHISPAEAGVRAQALEPDGSLVDDFRIREEGDMIHVLNAPSPAATASLTIGRTIAQRARKRFAS